MIIDTLSRELFGLDFAPEPVCSSDHKTGEPKNASDVVSRLDAIVRELSELTDELSIVKNNQEKLERSFRELAKKQDHLADDFDDLEDKIGT